MPTICAARWTVSRNPLFCRGRVDHRRSRHGIAPRSRDQPDPAAAREPSQLSTCPDGKTITESNRARAYLCKISAVMNSARRSRAMRCHHAVMGFLLVGVRGRPGRSRGRRRGGGGLVCCCGALPFSCSLMPLARWPVVRAGGWFDPPHGHSAVSRTRPRDVISSCLPGGRPLAGFAGFRQWHPGGTCERFGRDPPSGLILTGRITQPQQLAQ